MADHFFAVQQCDDKFVELIIELASKSLSENKSTFTLRKCSWIVLKIYLTGKNNGFPILDILGYLKNTHKNPKFGRERQIPIWELGWEFPDWDLSHSPKFGIL